MDVHYPRDVSSIKNASALPAAILCSYLLIFALAHAVSEHGSVGFCRNQRSRHSCRQKPTLTMIPDSRVLSENRLELNREQLSAAELRLRLEQIYSLCREGIVFVEPSRCGSPESHRRFGFSEPD